MKSPKLTKKQLKRMKLELACRSTFIEENEIRVKYSYENSFPGYPLKNQEQEK